MLKKSPDCFRLMDLAFVTVVQNRACLLWQSRRAKLKFGKNIKTAQLLQIFDVSWLGLRQPVLEN